MYGPESQQSLCSQVKWHMKNILPSCIRCVDSIGLDFMTISDGTGTTRQPRARSRCWKCEHISASSLCSSAHFTTCRHSSFKEHNEVRLICCEPQWCTRSIRRHFNLVAYLLDSGSGSQSSYLAHRHMACWPPVMGHHWRPRQMQEALTSTYGASDALRLERYLNAACGH